MKAKNIYATFSLLPLLFLSGCGAIGAKSMSVSVVYVTTTVLSLLLLIGYCSLVKKKDPWFTPLFASVFIVNAGYFSLSISKTLEEALLANRIAYLGSALLPLAMLMIIKNSCNIRFPKALTTLLITTSILVFLIAASPGYLDIYYKAVTLETANGVSVLNKEYGSWHCVYLFYLLSYFGAMIATIIYSIAKRKVNTAIQAVVLIIAVFINISVWFLEQIVKIDFEFLSVSYIISELFLLAHYLLIQENEWFLLEDKKTAQTAQTDTQISNANIEAYSEPESHPKQTTKDEEHLPPDLVHKCEYLTSQLPTLTATEKTIYKLHLERKSTKEILEELGIKENTLKYHNKNIYSKLGVSSRKQLREIAEHAFNNTN